MKSSLISLWNWLLHIHKHLINNLIFEHFFNANVWTACSYFGIQTWAAKVWILRLQQGTDASLFQVAEVPPNMFNYPLLPFLFFSFDNNHATWSDIKTQFFIFHRVSKLGLLDTHIFVCLEWLHLKDLDLYIFTSKVNE